jgi:hypothetical protein
LLHSDGFRIRPDQGDQPGRYTEEQPNPAKYVNCLSLRVTAFGRRLSGQGGQLDEDPNYNQNKQDEYCKTDETHEIRSFK